MAAEGMEVAVAAALVAAVMAMVMVVTVVAVATVTTYSVLFCKVQDQQKSIPPIER